MSEQTRIYTLDLDRPHIQYRDAAGARIPGVTTVLGVLAKPALVSWANRQGLAGIDTSKVVQEAATIGTITHARIEAWLRGMEFGAAGLPPDLVERSTPGVERFRAWWEGSGYRVRECERVMVSERFRCGGTADILANRGSITDLVDIKTSKAVYPEMHIQTATYAEMYTEITGCPVDAVWIVRLGKEVEDDVEIVPVLSRDVCIGAFRACRELYDALGTLRRESRG